MMPPPLSPGAAQLEIVNESSITVPLEMSNARRAPWPLMARPLGRFVAVMSTEPLSSLMTSSEAGARTLSLRFAAKVTTSGPGRSAALRRAWRSEPIPSSLVVVTSVDASTSGEAVLAELPLKVRFTAVILALRLMTAPPTPSPLPPIPRPKEPAPPRPFVAVLLAVSYTHLTLPTTPYV